MGHYTENRGPAESQARYDVLVPGVSSGNAMTPGSANDAPAAAAAAAASAASAVGENQRTVGHGNLSGRVLPVVVEMQREPHSFAAAAAADTIASDTEVDGEWPSDASSYDILSKIGQGAFATVFLAKCHSSPPGEASGDCEGDGEEDGGNGVCAIKILDLENVDANFTDIRLEVQTMRMSQHNNILRCYTSFIRETNLYLVMPLMNRGSSLRCLEMTRKHLKRRWRYEQHQRGTSGTGGPPDLRLEEHLTYILFETLKGLQYIHGNLHLIHRDIKAGNVLLDWMAKVKVADFGVSGWLQRGGSRREQTRTFVGTPAWMSPELMEQVEGYNHKTDLWSLGITALELAKGYAPYAKFPPIKVLLLTIQEEPPSLDTYDDEEDVGEEDCSDDVGRERYDTGTGKWSNTFRDVINRCLQKNPKDRPDCDDLLNHAHFRHLLDEDALDSAQTHTKEAVCDVVGDIITSSSSAAAAAAKKKDKEG